jgi:hypothetical protein
MKYGMWHFIQKRATKPTYYCLRLNFKPKNVATSYFIAQKYVFPVSFPVDSFTAIVVYPPERHL